MNVEVEVAKPKYELFQKVVVEFHTHFRGQNLRVLENMIIIGIKAQMFQDTPSVLYSIGKQEHKKLYKTRHFSYEVLNPEKGDTDTIMEHQIFGVWEAGGLNTA